MPEGDVEVEKGKLIYAARTEGATWSAACAKAEMPLTDGLLSARDYADEQELPWPPVSFVQGKHPGEFSRTCELKQIVEQVFVFNESRKLTEDELMTMYEMRQADASWNTIAARFDSEPSTVHANVWLFAAEKCLPAPKAGIRNRVGWTNPLKFGKKRRAYEERLLSGDSWPEIALRLGHTATAQRARRFAKENGLPWPIPALDWEPGLTPLEQDSLTYFYRGSGLTWKSIGRLTGLGSDMNTVQRAAQRHMTRTGLPYPLPLDHPEEDEDGGKVEPPGFNGGDPA